MCLPAAAIASTCMRCLVCGVASTTASIDLSASTSSSEAPSSIWFSAAKSRTVSGSSVMPRLNPNGAPKSRAPFTSVFPHQPRPTIAVLSMPSRLCCRRRAGLLERMGARECVVFGAGSSDARNRRIRREVDLEETRAGHLAREADIRDRDLITLAIGSGFFFGGQVFLEPAERQPVPMLRPFHDAGFVDLVFLREIFAHARHDQRVGIARNNLGQASHTGARLWFLGQ